MLDLLFPANKPDQLVGLIFLFVVVACSTCYGALAIAYLLGWRPA